MLQDTLGCRQLEGHRLTSWVDSDLSSVICAALCTCLMSAWHACQVIFCLVRRVPHKMQRLILLEDMIRHTAQLSTIQQAQQ